MPLPVQKATGLSVCLTVASVLLWRAEMRLWWAGAVRLPELHAQLSGALIIEARSGVRVCIVLCVCAPQCCCWQWDPLSPWQSVFSTVCRTQQQKQLLSAVGFGSPRVHRRGVRQLVLQGLQLRWGVVGSRAATHRSADVAVPRVPPLRGMCVLLCGCCTPFVFYVAARLGCLSGQDGDIHPSQGPRHGRSLSPLLLQFVRLSFASRQTRRRLLLWLAVELL